MNPHDYSFRQAVNAYFLAPTAALRPLLPPDLVPLEARPMHGVLAITTFDFHSSSVGPYTEMALSVLVPPFARRGGELPFAATYPFSLHMNTEVSARDARERWHLPFSEDRVEMDFTHDDDTWAVSVSMGGAPVLELTVGRAVAEPSTRLYQVFSRNGPTTCRVPLRIDGGFEQRDDEVGRLVLHDHPFADRLDGLLADDVPILEQCMDGGEQHFGEVVAHRGEGAA